MKQSEKILTLMCRAPNKFWLPTDFMRSDLGELFVGYEASARFSELAKAYPNMLQSIPDGKYIKRRIKVETIREWFPGLPKNYKQIIAKGLDYYPHIPENKFNQTLAEEPKQESLL